MHISFQSNFSQSESGCMVNEYDRTCILACYQLVCILQCYYELIRLILCDPCVPFLNANHNRIWGDDPMDSLLIFIAIASIGY